MANTASLVSWRLFAIANASFVAAPADAPAGTAFPHGLADFTVTGCATAQVNITYPSAIPAGAKYYKEVGGVYSEFAAMINGNLVTFTLTDGVPGGSDPAELSIHDPSGIGFGAGSGGAAGIPALGPLGLALLSGLLGVFGLWSRRRG